MTERVKRLMKQQEAAKPFPICTEKVGILLDVYESHPGLPKIVLNAMASAANLDKRTVMIMPDELLVGNVASKYMGLEVDMGPAWTDKELDEILAGDGTSVVQVAITEEDRKKLRRVNEYFYNADGSPRGRTKAELMGSYYDDDRLWPLISAGFLNPAWKSKTAGRGRGKAGGTWCTGHGNPSQELPLYGKVIYEGIQKTIDEVDEELKKIRYTDFMQVERGDFLNACKIALPAIIRHARRFSDLAKKMAETETNAKRKAELLEIADICQRVPAEPARTFREGLQAFLFYYFCIADGTSGFGRLDQLLYPLYKADLEAGRLTRESALELIECFRLKVCEINGISGGKAQREKWAGMSKWHVITLAGCDKDGNCAVNDLSYLHLEAAKEMHMPHPTLLVRVGKNTPAEFMNAAMDVAKTGIGYPNFVSEDSYINFITSRDVPLKDAREFAICGCIPPQIPGKSRMMAAGMMNTMLILDMALHDGVLPVTGRDYGLRLGKLTDFKNYEEFYQAFLKYADLVIGFSAEEHNINLTISGRENPDVITSAFMQDGVKYAIDISRRKMLFENISKTNCVGLVNIIDSLTVLKTLVYDTGKISPETMMKALEANWVGYEDIHKMCLDAPKFGNNDPVNNEIAKRLWHDFATISNTKRTVFNVPPIPGASSISSHTSAGAVTSATPDGRVKGETLADGSNSPAQGRDKSGPLAVFNSIMNINLNEWEDTLLNMKFNPDTLKTDADVEKAASMIKVFLTNGGKMVQFNVVDRSTLVDAKVNPEKHSDLIVRVAGYSAYFTTLTKSIQNEVIERTEHDL